VAPHDEPALEAQQQVLADRLDALEGVTVDLLRHTGRLSTRVRRLDLELLPDQHLEPLSGASERVAFGHDSSLNSGG